ATKKFETHIVGVRISTAFGEEIEPNFQTKPTVFGPRIYGKGKIAAPDRNTNENICYGLTAFTEPGEKEMLQNSMVISLSQQNDKTFEYLGEYSKKISFQNGRITEPFPLKDNVLQREDSYAASIRRLNLFKKRFSETPSSIAGTAKYFKST
ncbi:hypothetical protein OSTOST_14556, partial [Ostertagia ostertagi]